MLWELLVAVLDRPSSCLLVIDTPWLPGRDGPDQLLMVPNSG